ncbi:uncharacterized protein LOC129716954 [Wyeomyia smithii]|uniref:uncharacterized protein LOC129716954 n=1 Tax=Wyeomyia smithii TaxID=174621 RepID=UPI002467EB14|nr:uncharacterized protein LOC129716954 [Wyeomyia smithii]
MIATAVSSHTQPSFNKQLINNKMHSNSGAAMSNSELGSVDRLTLSSSSVHAPFPASSGTVLPPPSVCQTVTPSIDSDSTVLLFTALVEVQDKFGQFQLARALLDSGFQSSFFSESLCQQLGLKRKKVNIPVSGIGQALANVRYVVTVQLASRVGPSEYCVECLVLPKLTSSLPTRSIDIRAWKILQHLPLADPQFHLSQGIDLIIGAELFSCLLQAEQISFDDKLPVLQKTSLGYTVAGKVPSNFIAHPVACHVSTLDSLDAQIKRFWEVEDFDRGKSYTLEEQQCETHFVNTHRRTAEGRYIVRLPVRQEKLPLIGETWSIAARRFTALERRFQSDEALRSDYVQFMEEYKQVGHMEEVSDRVALPQNFLPHHAIHRPDSTTTKTRVVFDGSVKSSNNLSLNDLLLTGPTVQPTLLSIVLNFNICIATS